MTTDATPKADGTTPQERIERYEADVRIRMAQYHELAHKRPQPGERIQHESLLRAWVREIDVLLDAIETAQALAD